MDGCVYKTADGKCEKFSDDEVISYCVEAPCHYERPSNADRIRAMSDEELAEWMNDGWLDIAIDKSMVSTEQWLEWLKLPKGYARVDYAHPECWKEKSDE
jgi:hypothetical protein